MSMDCLWTIRHSNHHYSIVIRGGFGFFDLKITTDRSSLSVFSNIQYYIFVYKITCPRCNACYVGQTSRHLQTRFKEHKRNSGPVNNHITSCAANVTEEDVEILATTSRGEYHLMTLEALWIREVAPGMNTKDEYRSRTLTIGFSCC